LPLRSSMTQPTADNSPDLVSAARAVPTGLRMSYRALGGPCLETSLYALRSDGIAPRRRACVIMRGPAFLLTAWGSMTDNFRVGSMFLLPSEWDRFPE
jgi:hypothetical protein